AVTAKKSAARKPVARAKSARPAHPKKRVIKAAKPAARRAAKPVVAAKKAVAKVAKVAKVAEKLRPKAAAPAPVAARTKPVPVPPPAGRRPEVDKKRTRRPRPRVQSNGAPVAAWLNLGEKPRPSSFIPAPPRAEAPSLIAAPPASSDRLFREGDLSELAVRTVPVRVDVEMNSGRVYLGIIPEEVSLRVGEGIEWDFRYLGGSDVTVDELVIEFEKPSPFPTQQFRSRKPGTARPHRQMSGAAQKAAAGKRVRYTVRAITAFKTDIGIATPWLTVTD
ncbi:MAG: hypothetical protein ACXVJT_00345, partial [Thermoanaerobaculia bacterium]